MIIDPQTKLFDSNSKSENNKSVCHNSSSPIYDINKFKSNE